MLEKIDVELDEVIRDLIAADAKPNVELDDEELAQVFGGRHTMRANSVC